jgi:hypothetical protein
MLTLYPIESSLALYILHIKIDPLLFFLLHWVFNLDY